MTKESGVIHPQSRSASALPATKTIRILVADDHLVYRIGIRNLLASEPGFEVIGEAPDGLQAIELYRALRPDVLLLDLRMPQKNGIEVVQTIRRDHPAARILVVTSYQTEEESRYGKSAVTPGAF